jgi:hypothetical protein
MKQLLYISSLILVFIVIGCKGDKKETSKSHTTIDRENYQSGIISSFGDQPTIAKTESDIIGVTYGEKEVIYYSESMDGGTTFNDSEVVGSLEGLLLGYSSGPQIAFTKNKVVITAPSRSGNLYSWFKDRAEENWQGPFRINDIDKSVEECLSSITVSNEGHIYSTWIDTRTSETSDVIMSSTSEEHPEEKNKGMKKPKAKIYVSVSMDNGKTWSKSDLVYKSPDGSVCECCRPSIESDKNGNLIIMFRNNIDGSRDLHYTMSKDKGKSFSPPQKLGSGTWKINGCPMDGGGFTSLGNHEIISAWQREGMVYTATSDLSEQLIGAGRAPSISGNRENYSLVYTKGDEVMAVHEPMTMSEKIGNGTSAKVLATEDAIIYMWISEKGIEYKKFKRI